MPNNIDLYKKCFVHKSSLKSQKYGCNERLEFLGDAVLGSIIAGFLYEKFPQEKENILSEMRTQIVNRKHLNSIGLDIHLDKHLQANIPNIRQNNAIGNCLEALIGAIYEDCGYTKTKQFIIDKILPYSNLEQIKQSPDNYKSIIIRYCQKNKIVLNFDTNEQDKQKPKPFTSSVLFDTNKIVEAYGFTKKEAEQEASRLALLSRGLI